MITRSTATSSQKGNFMKYALAAAAIVLAAGEAHAHHEEIVRQAAITIDLGWPIVVTVAGAMVAYLKAALR
jgi:5,10-methylene-tetrahydrofolate dehydrogenase/methenyl tetrahydrofolate cyclohydrolase